jgi:hypothetical protein
VKTTPQTFIDGVRIGGYDDLRRYFGLSVPDSKAVSYRPVLAVFAMTALMAMAASLAAFGIAGHGPRGRMVHRVQHGRARDPEASERRSIRDDVPGL